MKIEEQNGVYLITQSPYQNFWEQWFVDIRDIGKNRPKLKGVLKDWWDTTAPGEWTTTYVDKAGRRAIVVRDTKLFMLFKLAWDNTDTIDNSIRFLDQQAPMIHLPYIALKVGRQDLDPVFNTRYDITNPDKV